MKRVKLMLDPKGSTLGRDLPVEELMNMTEEQKQAYQSEQMMRGFGNKCLRKMLETMLMSAFFILFMYMTGILEHGFKIMNPDLVKTR